MRLRLAKKIMKAVGTPREAAYRDADIGRAVARFDRTKSARENRRFFRELCRARIRMLVRNATEGRL